MQRKKGGESTAKGSNVKKDSSPCMGKVKQGSWKRKEGRPLEETMSSRMDIDVGQKHKTVMEEPSGSEFGRKKGKTTKMTELFPTTKVARQAYEHNDYYKLKLSGAWKPPENSCLGKGGE